MTTRPNKAALKYGYQLHWYKIESVLGQGGFGITYLALDTNLEEKVAIKEFLPREFAVREDDSSVYPATNDQENVYFRGLDRFLFEGRTLSRFRHHNIVRIRSIFEHNNTAYMVMDYEEGSSLAELLKGKKTFDENRIRAFLLPIVDGLGLVHEAGFIHRDIKPANIFIRKDDSPVLLDFGSARQALVGQTQTLTSLVSEGFAPYEQYNNKSDKQGPWTDIYGLGATVYRAMTGISPVDALVRGAAVIESRNDPLIPATKLGQDRFSPHFLVAIDHALSFRAEERPQSVHEWQRELHGEFDHVDVITHDEDDIATESVGTEVVEPPVSTPAPTAATKPPTASPTSAPAATQVQEPSQPISTPHSGPGTVVQTMPHPGSKLMVTALAVSIVAIIGLAAALFFGFRATGDGRESQGPVEEIADQQKALTDAEQQLPEAQSSETSTAVDNSANTIADNASSTALLDSQIQMLLAAAETDINEVRLTSPPGNNALEKYRMILELQPDNRAAQAGINSIVQRYISLATQASNSGQYDTALSYLDKAEDVQPNAETILLARQVVEFAKENSRKISAAKTQPVEEKQTPEEKPPVLADTQPSRREIAIRWTDADRDCQDTKQEVLIRESQVPPALDSRGCNVVRGRWYDPISGAFYTDPNKLDVDQFIPVREAFVSGGRDWDDGKRRNYVNDLANSDTLIIVAASLKQQRSKADPATWLPPNSYYHCDYAGKWWQVKQYWYLNMDARERQAMEKIQRNCRNEASEKTRDRAIFDQAITAYDAGNKTRALQHFLTLANKGYASAMLNVANMYRAGDGITKDLTQAMSWYRRAAARGSEEAFEILEQAGLAGN